MAEARFFVEVKKFTSLHSSELLIDADFTSRKLAERTFFGEAKHHIKDPSILVLLCQKADYGSPRARAKYRPDRHVTLEPAFFGL